MSTPTSESRGEAQAPVRMEVLTFDVARRAGRRDGRRRYWRLGLPPWGRQEPRPAWDDKEAPGIVQQMRGAARLEIDEIRARLSARREALKAAMKKDRQTCATFDAAYGSRHKVHEARMAKAPYLALMIVVGVTEAFFNMVVFQTFGFGYWETIVMASTLGVFLPYLAHLIGSYLKEGGQQRKVWILGSVVAAALLGVVLLRAFYIEETMSTGILDMSAPPWLLTVIFLAINALVFVGAAFLSHRHAASDPTFERELSAYDAACARLHDADAELEHLPDEYQDRCDQARQKYRQLLGEYRDANLDARRKGAPEGAEKADDCRWDWYPPDLDRDVPVPPFVGQVGTGRLPQTFGPGHDRKKEDTEKAASGSGKVAVDGAVPSGGAKPRQEQNGGGFPAYSPQSSEGRRPTVDEGGSTTPEVVDGAEPDEAARPGGSTGKFPAYRKPETEDAG